MISLRQRKSTYLLLCSFGFILASSWFQMVFKKMIQLLAECGELLVVCVLDACSSNYGFEELTLKDNSEQRSEILEFTYF